VGNEKLSLEKKSFNKKGVEVGRWSIEGKPPND